MVLVLQCQWLFQPDVGQVDYRRPDFFYKNTLDARMLQISYGIKNCVELTRKSFEHFPH